MRLIDAHELSAQYKVEYDHADAMGNAHRKKGWQGALQLLYDAPTIDPESLRPKGRWAAINADCRGYANAFECSNCETISHTHIYMKECDFDFCPNCGAKMEG